VGIGVIVGVEVAVGVGEGVITDNAALSFPEQTSQPVQLIVPQKGLPVHFLGSSGESTWK